MEKIDTIKLMATDDEPDRLTKIDCLEARVDACTRKLADEDARWSLLMEQSRDGIVILDQDGQVYESNRKFAEMLGYPHDAMNQLNVKDWDFLQPPTHLMEMIHSVDEKGDHFETKHRRRDGSLYDVEISTNAAWFAGQKLVFCICRDITERKRIENNLLESEEMQKKLLQTVPDLIVKTDMEGTILFVNDFGSAGFETLRGQDIYGKNILSFVAEHDVPRMLENLRLRLTKNLGPQEYQLHLSDDGVIDVEINGDVIRDKSENPMGMVYVVRDITSRKQSQLALEQKNQEMEQFVCSISHDLTSPLVTVKTFVSMLRQDLQGGDQLQINKDLSYIDRAADKMQQLLDALLQYSRIGRIDTRAQCLSAGQAVEDCLTALAGILQQYKIQVSTSALPQQLQGNPIYLGQIWQNLIENAVKYRGDQPQPHIEIGATQKRHDVVFYVRDNGMGIAPEHSERIFNLFAQLNPKNDGSGLGLALVKKIVSIYQGKVWVESAGKGRGSCFMFTLPGALDKKGTST